TILWFIVEPTFALLYGDNWSRSGIFVKILIPMFALRFVVSSMMHGFIVSGKQLLKLLIQSLFIIESITIYTIAKLYHLPIEEFLLYLCIVYFFNCIILFLILYFTSREITK